MGVYAKTTSVSPGKSRGEIELILKRYGADGFAYGYMGTRAVVQFQIGQSLTARRVRFNLPIPPEGDFKLNKGGWARSNSARKKAHEQGIRVCWRALTLSIKAKLEAVESGIAIFDEEFMAQLVLPDGATMAEKVLPQYRQAIENGKPLPPLLGM
jgi:hypothetical protein